MKEKGSDQPEKTCICPTKELQIRDLQKSLKNLVKAHEKSHFEPVQKTEITNSNFTGKQKLFCFLDLVPLQCFNPREVET